MPVPGVMASFVTGMITSNSVGRRMGTYIGQGLARNETILCVIVMICRFVVRAYRWPSVAGVLAGNV